MKKISPNDSLANAIILLEARKEKEFFELKEQFHAVQESLKPINLLKDTFKSVTNSPDIKKGIGKTLIGVTSEFLMRNIFFRKTYNPVKIIAGLALQTVVTGIATNNSDKIKSTSQKIFGALLGKLKRKKTGTSPIEIQPL
jgi:hypothetical protein